MFGREYANYLEILTLSFEQMNDKYRKLIKLNNKNSIIEKLRKIYISIFGIPEIGFQIRNLYFEKIISSKNFKNKFKFILDAGCGIGAYTFYLGKKFKNAKIVGGDIDKRKLKICKIISDELLISNTRFIYFDITKPITDRKYDLIINVDVLEHIKRYELALKNFSYLLKKGGFLCIHVPQPNQKRIFSSLKNWYHSDHVREGIFKKELENKLEKVGFEIIESRETFGFFGKLAWELNHITLSKNFFLAGIIYPLLYLVAKIDPYFKNKNGLGIAALVKKVK